MNVRVTGKELKIIKEVIDFLNEAFPSPEKGIPSAGWIDGKMVKFYAKIDPYFSFYKGPLGIGWVCCTDYNIWDKSSLSISDCCEFLSQEIKIKVNKCYVHPAMIKKLQREHKEKKIFFFGKISW